MKMLLALVAALAATAPHAHAVEAVRACQPPPAQAFTFEEVATGDYESLYVPGGILIPHSAGRVFSVEDTLDPGACPVEGRHLAVRVTDSKRKVISFHKTTGRAGTVSFDYAMSGDVHAAVIPITDGLVGGSITLEGPSGHFEYVSPPGKETPNLGIYYRSDTGDGILRVDNVSMRDDT
ncbi:hypothetical protein L2Y94_13080 [Luteibacter aegosomatis]|uniref:hypothetical protein n=1 Tax=Luteibacter aegosomatis TaxID=2911537 RepID=UPI001FF9634A|nr:hypothetical protein [Luteibacter aegosomatis]UPG84277.1 hypothetical protein L2Y94_13080 [Luteibacter aegosomatis]